MTQNSPEETPEQEPAEAAPPAEVGVPSDIREVLGDALLEGRVAGAGIDLTVRPGAVAEFCRYLQGREEGPFVYLASLAGVDYGDELGVTYHLYRECGPERVVIHVRLPRDDPRLPSVAAIFPAANWKEREAAELYGVVFEGHPDPRKLLLPEDWEGYPLRKDYVYPTDHPYLSPDPQHEMAAGDGEDEE